MLGELERSTAPSTSAEDFKWIHKWPHYMTKHLGCGYLQIFNWHNWKKNSINEWMLILDMEENNKLFFNLSVWWKASYCSNFSCSITVGAQLQKAFTGTCMRCVYCGTAQGQCQSSPFTVNGRVLRHQLSTWLTSSLPLICLMWSLMCYFTNFHIASLSFYLVKISASYPQSEDQIHTQGRGGSDRDEEWQREGGDQKRSL